MSRRKHISRIVFRKECMISILLLILAILLVAPAVRNLTATAAQDAKATLESRLEMVADQARREGCAYTVTLMPNTSRIRVIKWEPGRQGQEKSARTVVGFSRPLPSGVIIASTTIPCNELAFSENGFILSAGKVVLHADDGSQAVLEVGYPEK